MTNLLTSIMIGIGAFPLFAVLCTIPIVLLTVLTYRKLNLLRILLNYAMLLYLLCVTALVLFPLPTADQAAALTTHNIQWIPFHFIADIIRETPFELNNPATYLPTVFASAIWQVIFNIMMFLPLGMYLRYYCGMSAKKIVFAAAMFSLLIEITQLTGIYGIYHGSYRFCDVDDLMANTLGGYLGYRVMTVLEHSIPAVSVFDVELAHTKHVYN